MAQKNSFFILILIMFFAGSVSAQMGGHGSGGYSGGGHSSGGHIGDHSGHMTGNMQDMPGDHSGHTGNHQDVRDGTNNTHIMNRYTAQKMMIEYMDNVSPGMYHFKNIKDKGSSYCTDVYSHEGKFMDRLVVDKKTGNIKSLLTEKAEE